jgi:hypothetical protein
MAGYLLWYLADVTGSSHALYLGASARIARVWIVLFAALSALRRYVTLLS